MYLLEPHPIFFTTSAGTLYTHGLFFALGAVVATLVLLAHTRELPLRRTQVLERALWIFGAGLLGARIGYLFSYPDVWTRVAQLWEIWEGGLVSYTGILAGLSIAWLSVKFLKKEQQWRWADAVVAAGLLGWAAGRLGNYYAGESVGVTSSVWTAFYGRVPIQLFEIVWCVLVYLLITRRPFRSPALAGVGLYLAGRLVIDIWRAESVYAGLHVSQWVSLLGCILIISVYRSRMKLW